MKGRLNLWLLLVVAVCGASYWFGRDLFYGSTNPPPMVKPTSVSFGGDDEQKSVVHLQVLNGTKRAGLAREFGLLLGRAGCVSDEVGNAPHSHFDHSFLVNRQMDTARLEKLATDLGGLPILMEFDGRSAVDAVLVLGNDAEQIRNHLNERERR